MRSIRFVSVLLAALAFAAPTATVSSALACAMKEASPVGTPEEMLVRAVKEMKDGRYGVAMRNAGAVSTHADSSKDQKAQAWTVIGFLRWKNGNKEAAMDAFKEAKKLHAPAIEVVLAKATAKDKVIASEIKKALEV